jgi:hypothetical protein
MAFVLGLVAAEIFTGVGLAITLGSDALRPKPHKDHGIASDDSDGPSDTDPVVSGDTPADPPADDKENPNHDKYHDIDHHGQSAYVSQANEIGEQNNFKLVPHGYSLWIMIKARSREIYAYYLRYPDKLLYNVITLGIATLGTYGANQAYVVIQSMERIMQDNFGIGVRDAVRQHGSPRTQRAWQRYTTASGMHYFARTHQRNIRPRR